MQDLTNIFAAVLQEEVSIEQDGSQQTISLLDRNSTFGQLSIFCNIPQPSTIRVLNLCRLLRIDKQSLSNIIDIYFYDGKKIYDNLIEVMGGMNHFEKHAYCIFHPKKINFAFHKAAVITELYSIFFSY